VSAGFIAPRPRKRSPGDDNGVASFNLVRYRREAEKLLRHAGGVFRSDFHSQRRPDARTEGGGKHD